MAWILQEAHYGAELPFAGLRFQRSFYEAITRLRIDRLRELVSGTDSQAGELQLSEESLWQQITVHSLPPSLLPSLRTGIIC